VPFQNINKHAASSLGRSLNGREQRACALAQQHFCGATAQRFRIVVIAVHGVEDANDGACFG
jgi:hypothetical protein